MKSVAKTKESNLSSTRGLVGHGSHLTNAHTSMHNKKVKNKKLMAIVKLNLTQNLLMISKLKKIENLRWKNWTT